jgi:quinolinate synthase
VEDIENVRKQFPETLILAHPECSPEVVDVSDFSGSTNNLIKRVQETDAPQYLLLTECSMGTTSWLQTLIRRCSGSAQSDVRI